MKFEIKKQKCFMEKDWSFYYEEGVKFLSTAVGWHEKANKFNNELKFNMLSMSMERLLISLLLFHDVMPFSETVSGLLREVKPFVDWPDEFAKEVKKLNKFMFLCSLDPGFSKAPDDSELEEVFKIARQLEVKVTSEVKSERSSD